MVFGNKGDDSGSGVAFSRDEVTGAPEPSGDFLPNAQGEDVVSGARTPRDIREMKDWLPDAHAQLMDILRTLEKHYEDMQDTEFTVEEGQLYMLQTRNAKRPAQAAVRFARDAVDEGLLDRDQALMTVEAEMLTALLVKTFDPNADYDIIAKGVPAAPGGAKGEVVFSAKEAVEAAAEDPPRAVVLVRPDTNANDVAGFHAAKGILTSLGGKASHAALVARGMGVPCVTAASELDINLEERVIRVGEHTIKAGDFIAINGTTGEITLDDVPLVDPTEDPAFDEILKAFETVLGWADDTRRLGVRTNADTPQDARKARELGAEGIGLCRTEHMFMAEDRQPKMRKMIMARDKEARKARARGPAAAAAGGLRGPVRGDEGAAGDDPAPGPAAARVSPEPAGAGGAGRARADRADGRPGRARAAAADDREDLRGEPDAGHARVPARDPLPRDLRDAGPRDHAGGEGDGRAAAPRDHDPARRLRARARDHARAGGPGRRRGGAARDGGLHRRDHDRAAPRVFCCRFDREICGFLLFRHK